MGWVTRLHLQRVVPSIVLLEVGVDEVAVEDGDGKDACLLPKSVRHYTVLINLRQEIIEHPTGFWGFGVLGFWGLGFG